MGKVFDTKAFAVGDDVAVEIPDEFGLTEGMDVELERTAFGILIRPKVDPHVLAGHGERSTTA